MCRVGAEQKSHQEPIINSFLPFKNIWDGSLGSFSKTKHLVEMYDNAKSTFQAPYRASPRQRQIEKIEVERMLMTDFREPGTVKWASPIVFVARKNSSLRFCVSKGKLKTMTRRDLYPISKMDKCLRALWHAACFRPSIEALVTCRLRWTNLIDQRQRLSYITVSKISNGCRLGLRLRSRRSNALSMSYWPPWNGIMNSPNLMTL